MSNPRNKTNEKTILVIDDEAPLRVLVSETLTGLRYKVLEAKTGQEGLRIAIDEKPDLILLDIALPGMDGFEVCRHLKEIPGCRHIPIVMLTAMGQEADRKRGIESGAEAYITKPFSPVMLLRRLEEILDFRRKDPRATQNVG